MTWFRVDDKLHSHRKVFRAGVNAMGLWVLAGSWSADQLQDGFIPDYVALRLDQDAEAHAAELVGAGLWSEAEKDGDRGWLFHQWDDHQPTRAEVESRRAVERDKKRRQRRDPSGQFTSSREESRGVSLGDISGTPYGTPEGVPPSRPVPSRPAAANAAAALPPPLDALKTHLDAAGLTVRWDKLTDTQAAEIAALLDAHGPMRLVRAAQKTWQRDNPPSYAQAWIGAWRALPSSRPKPEKCDLHRLEQPCRSCAADAKVGEAS